MILGIIRLVSHVGIFETISMFSLDESQSAVLSFVSRQL